VPQVSIIVPCYNEQATIRLLLDALYLQTFPRKDMEVVIADGMSTDGTRDEIFAWVGEHPGLIVRVVDNFKRAIPSGVNRAIEAARGEFIVRLDAHSMPNLDYIELCVTALQDGRGDNVGGIWRIRPGGTGEIPRSIAAAAAHPLGVGGVQYRVGGQPQAVDTVPFGAFRRDLVEHIGLYDETLLSNEDYEYNARIRKTGGVVWFDPNIQSTYFARSTFRGLARQYWRYGYWKMQMLRRYPETIRWRQGLPPLLVLSVLILIFLSIFFGWARCLLILETSFYGLTLVFAGFHLAIKHASWQMIAGVPLAISTMHFCWGTAFLWSSLKTIIGRAE
jgi:cellulose synthase/poly-beta-1,6-N-acetylglucosamine synthase-like glycosyltransferase